MDEKEKLKKFLALSVEEKRELVAALEEKEARHTFNKLSWFEPYVWQKTLCNATLKGRQCLAMTANQIGKSTIGAYITACHLTGRYPDWWKGRKFTRPTYCWAAGVSNDTTRDIMQTELFGLAEDDDRWGTGMVPLDCIGKRTRKRGVTGNTYDSVMVKFHNELGKFVGYSRIGFKSYEMGEEKFFGRPVDYIWLDEQPPSNIYTQCITRTVATRGDVVMTFTPEQGITPVVHQFMHERKPGQYLLQASWDDAPHLDEETKEQLLAQYPPHERDLRSKGIPVFGSGLVFPIGEELITCEYFEIPENWPRLAGLDFGWDHPTAAVWIALDPQSDTIYVYDEYTKAKATALAHAAALREKPHFIPIAWPRDGLQTDKGSGTGLAKQYRDQGCNLLHDWFTNPMAPGETGKGNQNIEPGVMHILHRMETGRFKVFPHLQEWWKEFRAYHRKEGKIYPMNDDLMSATRYATMSIERYGVCGQGSTGGYHMSGDLPIRNYTV
ncbi:MAG: terminase [Bacteroidetes bacterium]|nr:MAG: terminase [Bacteroidota bacterium]RLD66844.1 MAG: terminase [Bacteroidota bacterium]